MQTSERKMKLKELNQTDDTDLKDEEVIYRIDIPANRYDMLCLEGIARALNIFRGTLQGVDYQLADMNGGSSARQSFLFNYDKLHSIRHQRPKYCSTRKGQ